METQIVRLDAPYNIICNSQGNFALHIATLIVVKERIEGVVEGAPMRDTLSVASYPVVAGSFKSDGQVWMDTELEDCLVVCRQNESVSLYTLKRVMEYCAKKNVYLFTEKTPVFFNSAMVMYNVKVTLPTDEKDKTIHNYEVRLKFEESDGGHSCMAYSDNDSYFYFYEYFDNEPPFSDFVPTNTEAIEHLAKLRDNYLRCFRYEGMRSISFTTEDEEYKWFVDNLNNTKVNE